MAILCKYLNQFLLFFKNNTCIENYPAASSTQKAREKGGRIKHSGNEGWGKNKDFWPEYWPLLHIVTDIKEEFPRKSEKFVDFGVKNFLLKISEIL